MSESTSTKEVVSVSAMARMVGMSRARFYQLMHEGVFPAPSRRSETLRPFFDRQQQEQCLEVRRTNCGIDGRAILFYAVRINPSVASTSRKTTRQSRTSQRRMPTQVNRDPIIVELINGLSQLGLTVSDRDVQAALVTEYPDGHDEVDRSELLRVIFGHLNRQNSNDNVTR